MDISSPPTKRTPRACERCRRNRRRCGPPFPCASCAAIGADCEVRSKARPRRATILAKDRASSDRRAVGIGSTAATQTPTAEKPTLSICNDDRIPDRVDDPFELIRGLVQNVLLEDCDYVLNCELLEPQQADVSFQPLLVSKLPQLWDQDQVVKLLAAFERFNGADIVDPDRLLAVAQNVLPHIRAAADPVNVAALLFKHRLPLESSAMLFASLAVGAGILGMSESASLYSQASDSLTKRIVCAPTFDLCLALFLQHVCILRTGTSTHARSLVAQAVQACHDVDLSRARYGTRGLHLYLLVYMADQYSALTHNTAPLIRTSILPSQLFDPLAAACPHLQPLINLVTVNGHIIERCHSADKLSPPSTAAPDETAELEARIGAIQTVRQKYFAETLPTKFVTDIYEPIARIHMLCCRIRLRAAGLSDPKRSVWVPAINITTHAATEILSTYFFNVYWPALQVLAQQEVSGASSAVGIHVLPATWRQVKWIMLSVLTIILAHWRGELGHDGASRCIAMARLLLEYPRLRFGDHLDEALLVITDIARIGKLRMEEHMRTLLPTDNPDFPRPFACRESKGCDPQQWKPLEEIIRAAGNNAFAAASTNDFYSAFYNDSSTFDTSLDDMYLWKLAESTMDDISFTVV